MSWRWNSALRSQIKRGAHSKTLGFKKAIAWLLAVLLSTQIFMVGAQFTAPKTAEAVTLGHNLVYAHAYGVRSDGIAFMSGSSYVSDDIQIINSAGQTTFRSTENLSIVSYLMDTNYLNGNLVIEKTEKNKIKDATEPDWSDESESQNENSHTSWDENADGTYTLWKHSWYYGLIDPRNGKTVIEPKYKTWDELLSACKAKGFNTELSDKVQADYEADNPWIRMLPDGRKVDSKYIWDDGYDDVLGYEYVDEANGKQVKISGYLLGNTRADATASFWNGLFRTNKQGKTMYYVTNSAGKVGAVEENGKVVIPFNYDSYFDAKQGSDLILLKKGNAWEYFDLNSVGYGSKSTSGSASSDNGQSGTTQKGKWVKSGNRWWYSYSNGTYAKGWLKVGSTSYYMDSKGWMKTGWQKISNKWYYFNKSGAMAKGWKKVGKSWYYLDSDGVMQTGKKTISGKTYYLKSSGAMKTGWSKENNKWFYYNKSGAMQTSKWIGNYYVGSDGVMATNTWIGEYHVNSKGKWDATRAFAA